MAMPMQESLKMQGGAFIVQVDPSLRITFWMLYILLQELQENILCNGSSDNVTIVKTCLANIQFFNAKVFKLGCSINQKLCTSYIMYLI